MKRGGGLEKGGDISNYLSLAYRREKGVKKYNSIRFKDSMGYIVYKMRKHRIFRRH